MKRIETRLARLEKTTPRPDVGPPFLCFSTEEAYQAALRTKLVRYAPGRPVVKVYVGVDVERV